MALLAFAQAAHLASWSPWSAIAIVVAATIG
jgi:hypothetical protein